MPKFANVYFYFEKWDRWGYFENLLNVASVPNVDEMVFLMKNQRMNYFVVKERIFDAVNNIVHIRVESAGIESNSLSLKGHHY